MYPKRRSLPLILLIFFSFIVILYTYSSHLSSPLANPNSLPNLHRQHFPPTFTFTVKVLAFDRLSSLRRCLNSLSVADYGGDHVDLHVFVDHFRASNVSDLVDRKLEESRRMLEFVDGFDWSHGDKIVHYRTGNVGLQAQWLEAWWPGSDDEFAFVVEDDLEVSKLYYRFLKGLIGKYYYEKDNYSPSIYGASLQRPRFVPGKHGNKLQLDGETHLFLYQLVGTWGQLLFPKPWKEFRLWYDIHKSKGNQPILEGMVTTRWYKKMGEKIWTPWFIKFIHSRDYYNIYTNFQGERALSISHRDAGVNYGKTAGPDSSLIDERYLDFDIWELHPLRMLKWYDFCFRQVFPGRIVQSIDELGSVLYSLQKQKAVILFILYKTSVNITKNLLCHLEQQNIQNFVFIGSNSGFLHELARRGNPVIDGTELIKSILNNKLSGIQHSDSEFIKETFVKAYAIKKCLEHGYDTWMIDANVIPVGHTFSELSDNSYNFLAAEDKDMLFVRHSPSSVSLWSDVFVHKLVGSVKSLSSSHTNSRNQMNFVQFVARALQDQSIAGKILDASKVGFRLDVGSATDSLWNGKKVVFWRPKMDPDSMEGELGNSAVWLIDSDLSCVAVVCHES